MKETMATRYWCHMCSQMVNPVVEVDIKCPFFQVGEQAYRVCGRGVFDLISCLIF